MTAIATTGVAKAVEPSADGLPSPRLPDQRLAGRTAVMAGLGGWVPPKVVTNHELAAQLDTTDEWIRTRTGIGQRFVVESGMSTSDVAVEAGGRALRSAGVSGVDLVVLATSTPDHPCPATAPEVASRLGLGEVPAFDVGAVCTGFVYALATAASMIGTGIAGSALVIGADTFSTILNPNDRTTRAVFGDGAGAVVLRAGEAGERGALLGFDLGSDGTQADLITVPAGGSQQRSTGAVADEDDYYFAMQGRSVFRNAVTRMSESSRTLAERIGWPTAEVDRLVAHQANVRILTAVAGELGLSTDRVVLNLDRVGNTVAASIPLALVDAATSGQLLPGHRVLLCGFGGGLTWGAAGLEYPALAVEPLPGLARHVFHPSRTEEKPPMSPLQEKIAELLVTHLGLTADAITPDTTYEQLSVDSLGLIEFTMIIQKELGVSLADDALLARTTIADTAELLESKGVGV